MAYDLHDLELIGLSVKTILKVQFVHQPGAHGQLEIEADLGEEQKDGSIHEAMAGQQIVLQGRKEGKKEILFCGVIIELEGESVGNSFHVKIVAYTFSYLMDIKRRSRSFQDVSMNIGAVLAQIVSEYGGECQLHFQDREIGEIAVQYNETDWEFMKRILSAWNIPLAASEVRKGIYLYAGVAEIPTIIEINTMEGMEKLIHERSYWIEKGIGVKDDEFIQYRLRLNSRVMLYSQVDFRNRIWIVNGLSYETIGGRLYPVASLRKKEGIREKNIYPIQLIGSALEGEIKQIKGEKVQIHLSIDDDSTKDSYWFPFSTPSASMDGSGWYYMPEKGDKVRVYFPTKYTKDVIAISAVSTYEAPISVKTNRQTNEFNTVGESPGVSSGSCGIKGNGAVQEDIGVVSMGLSTDRGEVLTGKQDTIKEKKDKMGDPTTKYLRTPDGHEIKLMKKGIEVICNEGATKLELLKSGKINLYASDSIHITTKGNIILRAKQAIRTHCKEITYITSQQGGSMKLNEEGLLLFKGTEILMN